MEEEEVEFVEPTYISRRLTAKESHWTEVRWSPRGSWVKEGSGRIPEYTAVILKDFF